MPKTNKKAESIPSGVTYGFWTVEEVCTFKLDYLKCLCVCGKSKNVNVYSLTSGKSKSCGCKSSDLAIDTRKERNNA